MIAFSYSNIAISKAGSSAAARKWTSSSSLSRQSSAAFRQYNNPFVVSKIQQQQQRRRFDAAGIRHSSRGGTPIKLSIADTPLGNHEIAAKLLNGLDVYTVNAADDHHPITVFGIKSETTESMETRTPILLLHGRTWSSVPVYHLLGGNFTADDGQPQESRSLMEALYSVGLQPYAMDFRGFGGTPKDATGGVEPNVCVSDVESTLTWIAQRHQDKKQQPVLLGWSQGALVAQLLAQKSPRMMSKLILYGSIYDPLVRYPRSPLYVTQQSQQEAHKNTFDMAIEDFTIEGTIPPEPARLFAEAALVSDPIKAVWKSLYQFNNCDPGRVNVPTLVIAGDQDPYAPLRVQADLFTNLGRGAHRTWSIISEADHAVHLLENRSQFVNIVAGFVNEKVL